MSQKQQAGDKSLNDLSPAWIEAGEAAPFGATTAGRLIQDSELEANDVAVPSVAREGAAVADVEVGAVAEADADAELGVDDGVAGGVFDAAVGRLRAVEHGPAEHFHDRRDVEAAVVHGGVAGADAVAQDVAGKITAVDRNPDAEVAKEGQAIAHVSGTQQRRFETDMVGSH